MVIRNRERISIPFNRIVLEVRDAAATSNAERLDQPRPTARYRARRSLKLCPALSSALVLVRAR
jgi:hypothetical protein